MSSAIKSEEQYRSKKEEVVSKFTKEFVEENYNYDAGFRKIMELLIADADPYAIIEQLILDRKRILKEYTELAREVPPRFRPK